jgi:predicted MFS family arabinose efflux permease
MPLERYRAVLRAPGVPGLLVVGFLARGPVIAVSAVLTLHVVLTLHLDYASAGLAATVLTAAAALGAPWRGRAIDRVGLRRALVPSIVVGGGVWLIAPWFGYPVLLVLALVGGVFSLPSFAVVRQALSVAVGPEHRRTTLALDSISVELSFMTGPAVAVVAATTWSTRGVLTIVGAAQILAGLAMWVLNPPVRSAPVAGPASAPPPLTTTRGRGRHRSAEAASRAAYTSRRARDSATAQVSGSDRRRAWFTPALLGVFATGAGAALVLAGSEVAVVAQLRHLGHLPFTGAVFVVWGITSMVGGFVYGALHREITPPVVLLGLGLLTLPIGLAGGPLTVALLVGLAGLFCAPALTATSTAVTRLVAEEYRGEALGWQGTAMTLGSGAGAPLAGLAADRTGAAGGYLAAGLAGIGLAVLALGLTAAYGSGRPTAKQSRRARPGDAPAAPVIVLPDAEPVVPAPFPLLLPTVSGASEAGARNTGARVPADTLTD